MTSSHVKNGGWHLVEDDPPPENTLVLCQGERGGMFLGIIANFISWRNMFRVPASGSYRTAVAWHELPEPCKL